MKGRKSLLRPNKGYQYRVLVCDREGHYIWDDIHWYEGMERLISRLIEELEDQKSVKER